MPSQTNLAAFTFDHDQEQSNIAPQNHILHALTVFYYRQYSDTVIDHHPISLVTLLLQFGSGVRDTVPD